VTFFHTEGVLEDLGGAEYSNRRRLCMMAMIEMFKSCYPAQALALMKRPLEPI